MPTIPLPPQSWGLLTAIISLYALGFGLMAVWS
jgi:hypothetical protein